VRVDLLEPGAFATRTEARNGNVPMRVWFSVIEAAQHESDRCRPAENSSAMICPAAFIPTRVRLFHIGGLEALRVSGDP
jgi:hypothetical protein